jgi:hypothetical protein
MHDQQRQLLRVKQQLCQSEVDVGGSGFVGRIGIKNVGFLFSDNRTTTNSDSSSESNGSSANGHVDGFFEFD